MTTGRPAAQNAGLETGPAHAPVTDIHEPDSGGPANQLTDNQAMPGAFGAPCVESAREGLKPRTAVVLPTKIAPGREAPRKPQPGDRHQS
jgi:hypothetical protein